MLVNLFINLYDGVHWELYVPWWPQYNFAGVIDAIKGIIGWLRGAVGRLLGKKALATVGLSVLLMVAIFGPMYAADALPSIYHWLVRFFTGLGISFTILILRKLVRKLFTVLRFIISAFILLIYSLVRFILFIFILVLKLISRVVSLLFFGFWKFIVRYYRIICNNINCFKKKIWNKVLEWKRQVTRWLRSWY